MKKIGDEELKRIEFKLLCLFKDVCDKHRLRYSILGGTLLGAVRHKGFIPWDDDIDVIMPRKDYEVFLDLCINNDFGFKILTNKTNKHFGYLFSKIYDPTTIIINTKGTRFNVECGVFIDIFVYDGMADNIKKSRRIFNKYAISRELLIASNWKRYFVSKTHPWYYEPIRLFFFIFSRFINQRQTINKIERNIKKYDFDSSKYVGNLSSDKRSDSIIETSNVCEFVELEFEGKMFSAIKGYDTYLRAMYGDYMKLPPIEKRITHHTFDAFYKDY